MLFAPLALATFIALAYAVENWRGERAWRQVQRELAAQGQPMDLAALVPPPVPDDQNLALAPLLRPVLAFHRGSDGNLIWEDRPGQNRLASVSRENGSARVRPPAARSWFHGERIDLSAWQSYYQDLAKEAGTPKPPRPSGIDPVLAERYGLSIRTNAVTATTNNVVPGFPQMRPLPPDLAARYGLGTNLTETEFRAAFTFPVPAGPGTPAADVLHALSRVDPELDALSAEAAQRPLGRFPVHYEGGPSWGILLPHLAQVKKLAMVLQLRATARLADGQAASAHADTLLAMRLAELTRDEPFLISQLVRGAAWTLALQPVWEGINDHRWDGPQLAAIAGRLRAVDLAAAIDRGLRGQQFIGIFPVDDENRARLAENLRAFGSNRSVEESLPPEQLELADRMIRYGPRGWFYQNQLTTFRRVGEERARFAAWYGTRAITNIARSAEMPVFRVRPYQFIGDQFTLMLSIRGGIVGLLRVQTQIHLSLAATALERHRLATGTYPASLDVLVPRYLDRVPSDPMTGGSLRYVRATDGTFQLYSVGLDGLDDGGTLVVPEGGGSDETARGPVVTAGDWIWPTGPR